MAQLKDLIVNGDAALNGNVVLNHDPTSAMQAATKQYVDNNSGGGEYIIEVPATLRASETGGVTGDASVFNAAVDAMQAGKKVYIKIRSEQLNDTVGTSSNWIYALLTGYGTIGSGVAAITYLGFDFFYGTNLINIMFQNSPRWLLLSTSFVSANGVSF